MASSGAAQEDDTLAALLQVLAVHGGLAGNLERHEAGHDPTTCSRQLGPRSAAGATSARHRPHPLLPFCRRCCCRLHGRKSLWRMPSTVRRSGCGWAWHAARRGTCALQKACGIGLAPCAASHAGDTFPRLQAAQQAAQLEVRQVGRQVAAAAEERRRLVAENAALSGMALYQMGAVEALHSGALAQAIDGCMALAGDPLAQQQQQQQQHHHHHHQQEEQQQEQQLQGLMPGGYAYQQQQCAAPMLLDAPAGFSAAGGGSCSTCAATARPEALPLDALGWHSASGLAGELQHQPGAQQQQSGLQEQQAQQAQPHMKQEAGEQRQAGQQWWPHLGVQCGMSSDSEGLSAAAAAPAAGLQVRAGAAPDDTPSTLEWAATHVMVLKQQMEQQEAALRRGVAANDTASSAAGARGTSGTSGTLHAVRQLLGDRSMWASQFRPSAWHKRLFMRVVPVAALSRRGAFFTKTLQRCVEQVQRGGTLAGRPACRQRSLALFSGPWAQLEIHPRDCAPRCLGTSSTPLP